MTPVEGVELIRPGHEGERTLKVLRGVARGFLSREIAKIEGIPKRTVDRERIRAHHITDTINTLALVDYLWINDIPLELGENLQRDVQLRENEIAILELRAMNLSVESIGERLSITPGSVRTSLSHIRRKFNARTVTHAFALYRYQQG